MKRYVVIGGGALVLLFLGLVLLLIPNTVPAGSRVERQGERLIIHGSGAKADLGYLAGGRYELTIDDNAGGCANSMSLVGEDGAEWFRIDPHLGNYKDFAKTRFIPGQRYSMRVSTYFGGGGLGPRPTPTPVDSCRWIFELAPLPATTG